MTETERECPSCAMVVPEDAEFCPYCSYEFPVQKPFVPWVVLLFVILLLGWMFGC